MDTEEVAAIAILACLFIVTLEEEVKTIDREYWVHPLNQVRVQNNSLSNYIKDFWQWTRSSTVVSLQYYFRVGARTISTIVSETCSAIWNVLALIYMKKPNQQDWERIAREFEEYWNFPNCVGAVDVKMVKLESPQHSGSTFFNYKQQFSIALQAVADANAKFVFVDVGDYGRIYDSGTFRASNFGQLFHNNQLDLPPPRRICDLDVKFPYVFVADEAYPLNLNFMRPYPRRRLDNGKRIYNYRHSRARRIVECAFGMLTKKFFRVLENAMLLGPDFVTTITMACCVLHNLVRDKEGHINDVHQELETVMDVERETPLTFAQRSVAALNVRQKLLEYFNSVGAVSWQQAYIQLTQN